MHQIVSGIRAENTGPLFFALDGERDVVHGIVT